MKLKLLLPLVFVISIIFISKAQDSYRPDEIIEDFAKTGIEIKNVKGINSNSFDFSPAYYDSGIVYVSSRKKSGPHDKNTGEAFFDLFFAEINSNGQPEDPESFSPLLNTFAHEGPVSFNYREDVIYFTRSNKKSGKDKKTHLKIYQSNWDIFGWDRETEVSFDSDDYSTCHPSISRDDSKMVFASDMPGGFGGMDLYVVEKVNGVWGIPMNLGNTINTEKNEVFPFLHRTGVLFFASEGHNSMGGLDIFMAKPENGEWKYASNLGQAINTKYDDFGLITDKFGKTGFLSSNRSAGNGKDDIYYFKSKESILNKRISPFVNQQIIVFDETTNERIMGTKITLFSGGNPVNTGNRPTMTNANGECFLKLNREKNYTIEIEKDGFFNHKIDIRSKDFSEIKPLEIPVTIDNCIYAFGIVRYEPKKSRIKGAKIKIIDKTTKEEYSAITDERGEFDFCLPFNHNYTVFAETIYGNSEKYISTYSLDNEEMFKFTINLGNEEGFTLK